MKSEKKSQLEFIVLMAALMSIVALSIDALLPALPIIGDHLGVNDPLENQKLITMIFLGLGIGQLIFGPLSDSLGRKPIVYIGFGLFTVASFICLTTKSFEMMVAGRILQGIGLACPRTMTIAMIRDSYSGDYMAKIISIVVMIFILVPVVAPTFGQFLIRFYSWKSIFIFTLLYGILIMIWFWWRQPETFDLNNKLPFSPNIYKDGSLAFFKIKPAVVYTLLSGFITGSFMVYLSSSQQIFERQYNRAEDFPLIFASLAISVGFATFLNSRLVLRFGMLKIVHTAMLGYVLTSLLFIILYGNHSNPSMNVLISFFAVQFFCIGFLFGNLRALAMEPMGHIAGIGSALNGFISTVMAVPIANYIGSFVKTSVTPLFIGFLACGLVSLLLFYGQSHRIRQKLGLVK